MSERVRITFDKKAKKTVLESLLNKAVDSEGFIVEKENNKQRVLNLENEYVTLGEFAGIRKGSEIFIKEDVHSILNLSKVCKK